MRSVVLLSCLVLAAVDVYPEVHPESRVERSLVTEQQTYEWLEDWQRRLGLQDWTIHARIVRIWELPKGTVANIQWSLTKRTAPIQVLHSVDSTVPRPEILRDTELSIVHELVHLSMAKLSLDSVDTSQEEEAVRKISAALMQGSGNRSAIKTARLR